MVPYFTKEEIYALLGIAEDEQGNITPVPRLESLSFTGLEPRVLTLTFDDTSTLSTNYLPTLQVQEDADNGNSYIIRDRGNTDTGTGGGNVILGSSGEVVNGFGNLVGGTWNYVDGSQSFIAGYANYVDNGTFSNVVGGSYNDINTNYSAAFGYYNRDRHPAQPPTLNYPDGGNFLAGFYNYANNAFGTSIFGSGHTQTGNNMTIVGQASANLNGTTVGINNNNDARFIVGNGTLNTAYAATSTSNAFIVRQSGLVTAPSLTASLIDTDAKALVTREYLNNNTATETHTHAFSELTSKPTTLTGYGITDAESDLGNPTTDGYILSSTSAGTRSWIPLPGESDTLQIVTDRGATTTNSITATSFIKSGGTASQFLKADGSTTDLSYFDGRYFNVTGDSVTGDSTFTGKVTLDGNVWHDSANGLQPFYITRYGETTGEYVANYLEDIVSNHYYQNDERHARFKWTINNTDTESNAGANANTHTFEFLGNEFGGYLYLNGQEVVHSGNINQYQAGAHTHPWAEITSTPTTLSGYGITDAESSLGNPATDGYVLSSTATGARSWVEISGGDPSNFAVIPTAYGDSYVLKFYEDSNNGDHHVTTIGEGNFVLGSWSDLGDAYINLVMGDGHTMSNYAAYNLVGGTSQTVVGTAYNIIYGNYNNSDWYHTYSIMVGESLISEIGWGALFGYDNKDLRDSGNNGNANLISGRKNTLYGGVGCTVSGMHNTIGSAATNGPIYGALVGGVGVDWAGLPSEPIMVLGNGDYTYNSLTTARNSFAVLKTGEVIAFEATNDVITNSTSGKVLTTRDYVDNAVGSISVDDSNYAKLDQTNTFTLPQIVGAPTTNSHAATKQYVDDNVAYEYFGQISGGSITETAQVVNKSGFWRISLYDQHTHPSDIPASFVFSTGSSRYSHIFYTTDGTTRQLRMMDWEGSVFTNFGVNTTWFGWVKLAAGGLTDDTNYAKLNSDNYFTGRQRAADELSIGKPFDETINTTKLKIHQITGGDAVDTVFHFDVHSRRDSSSNNSHLLFNLKRRVNETGLIPFLGLDGYNDKVTIHRNAEFKLDADFIGNATFNYITIDRASRKILDLPVNLNNRSFGEITDDFENGTDPVMNVRWAAQGNGGREARIRFHVQCNYTNAYTNIFTLEKRGGSANQIQAIFHNYISVPGLPSFVSDSDANTGGMGNNQVYVEQGTGYLKKKTGTADSSIGLVTTSRNFTADDHGKILLVTASVTLTYPAIGVLPNGFKCELDVDSGGHVVVADSATTPGDDLDAPEGTTLEANKIGTVYVRPDNNKLRLKGEFI